ncbi:MAG: tetratricopeptide repeat protein [Alphaproteobacteria bacterium]
MKKLIKKIFISVCLLGILSSGFFQNHSIVHFNHANAQTAQAQTEEDIKAHLESIKRVDKLIKQKPKVAFLYRWRGDSKYALRLYESAIKDFDKAIELDPNDYDFYYLRGAAKYKLKQYKSAKKDFDMSIKLHPRSKAYISINFPYPP